MNESKVTVYGAYWCPDCRRSKKFLGEQFIPYRWVDIEQDRDGETYVLQRNYILLQHLSLLVNFPMLIS